jgi:hypothetical protein
MSCKKAIGVAEQMKDKYAAKLEVSIYTLDSMEAMKYHFRGSTNVLFDDELLSLDLATDPGKLDEFLSQRL